MENNPVPGVSCGPASDDNLFLWNVILTGPSGSPYEVCGVPASCYPAILLPHHPTFTTTTTTVSPATPIQYH